MVLQTGWCFCEHPYKYVRLVLQNIADIEAPVTRFLHPYRSVQNKGVPPAPSSMRHLGIGSFGSWLAAVVPNRGHDRLQNAAYRPIALRLNILCIFSFSILECGGLDPCEGSDQCFVSELHSSNAAKPLGILRTNVRLLLNDAGI